MVDVQYITRTPPIWLNPFFYVTIGLVLLLIFYIIYHYISIHLKNRTGFRIMHGKNVKTIWFKNKDIPSKIEVDSKDPTSDGTRRNDIYYYRPDKVYSGKWGYYIDFYYGISEPIDHAQQENKFGFLPNVFKDVSALLNTELYVDLLLSKKFKEFIGTMLVIILIILILDLGASAAANFTNPSVVQCNLLASNQTLQTLSIANALK